MSKIAFIFVVSSFLAAVRSQTWTDPTIHNQLHPVHGLYVKPSSDGTTGDLYVAASEDNGTKAQWLTDQPVNFLPSPAQAPATQTVPVPYPTFPAHEENSSAQKRAVLTKPPVAPVQYAYALPFNPTESQMPYPYAFSAPSSTPETASSSATQCEKTSVAAATAIPYNPFQYFYPHMTQAYANAKNILKESGMSDEKASSVVPQASPFWPTSYSYPYPMYVVMDPSAWLQSQSTQATSKPPTVEISEK